MARYSRRTRRTLTAISVLVCATITGAIWWTVGYLAFLAPTDYSYGGLLFLFAIIGAQAGLVSPFIVMVYLKQFTDDVVHETALKAAGLLLMPATAVAFAYFGVFELLGITEVLDVFAYFNGLFGLVLGGILGHKLVENLLRERGLTGEWADTA